MKTWRAKLAEELRREISHPCAYHPAGRNSLFLNPQEIEEVLKRVEAVMESVKGDREMDNESILVCSPWEERAPGLDVVCRNCQLCRRAICVDAKNIPVVEEKNLKLWCYHCFLPRGRAEHAKGELKLIVGLVGGKSVAVRGSLERMIRRELGID